MSNFRVAAVATLCTLGLAVAQSATPGFAQQCDALVAQARIHVTFEDAEVLRDNSRNLEQLRNLSRLSSGPYHQVYGLTQAQAGARYAMRAALARDADGSVCAVPSLEVTIAVSGLTVYLARELTNSCKRAIVDDHEMEHVAVWRSHLRAGARLLEPLLRDQLGRAFVFATADAAQAALRQRVDAVLNPMLQRLQEGIVQANRDIDSAQSYQATGQRIQACP